MRYYLDLNKIPRSVGRAEWKRIWRDKRVITKKCVVDEEAKITMLRLGRVPDFAKKHMIDELIYPPIILGPYQ